MKLYTLYGLILSLTLMVYGNSNGQTTFQKTFGGTNDDVATWVANTSTGYIVAGHTTTPNGDRDGYLLNLDPNGAVIWQKTVGGTLSDQFKIALETSNGFMVLGETESYGAADGEAWLLHFDANGGLVWSKTIGDSTNVESSTSLIAVSGGRFLIGGTQINPGMSDTSSWFSLVDNSGSTIWSRNYTSGEKGNMLHSNFVENGVIFASGVLQQDGGFARIDLETGNFISSTKYAADSSAALYYIQPTADSNLLLCDLFRDPNDSFEMKQWVNKVAKDGQTIWSKLYSRPNGNLRGRIEDAGNDNYLLTPYDGTFSDDADALLAKIDHNGNVLWSYNYGLPGLDWLSKSQLTPDGGFISVGSALGANGDRDVLMIKTDSAGLVQGCCARPGDVTAVDYLHADSTVNVMVFPWVAAVDKSVQAANANLSGAAYCGSQNTEISIDTMLCSNVAFVVDSVSYFAPNTFDITLPGVGTCDTIVHYTLIALPQVKIEEAIMLCPGDSVSIGGQQYTQADTVVVTLPNSGGCDTLYSYIITILPQPTLTQSISFCVGDSITINGQVYTQTSTVLDTIAGNGTCDTAITYILTQVTQQSQSDSISICAGDSITIGGQVYSQSGMVIDTISGNGACDTVVTYTLTVFPYPTATDTISFCAGDSITVNGQVYTQSGVAMDTIPGNGACDTVVTYTLTVLPYLTATNTISFCNGDSIVINDQIYTQSGIVADTLQGNGVCDTILTYTLILLPQPTLSETISFCNGDTIAINGQVYTQSGTVLDTIAGVGACDTIVTYTLILQVQPTLSETISFCNGDSITIGGQVYTQSGTVVDTIPGTSSCDTIATYTLIFLQQPTIAEFISFCAGDSIIINGQVYTQSGTVTDTVSSSSGCDTLVTYTLIQLAPETRAETITFCVGDTVTIGGQIYTQAGTVVDTIPAVGSCDTIVTYTLVAAIPGASTASIQCPSDMMVTVNPGSAPVVVNYIQPTVTSTCPCPGTALTQTTGAPSGGLFPLGATQVCYIANDSCGNTATCCFNITVVDQPPCDVKVIGCMRYELLSITKDATQKLTYRIRVVNNCPNKMIYTAIQLPNGVSAKFPISNSIFTTEGGRDYEVRNPNFQPFYSVRFKSTTDSISGGGSDIFKYTLPAQSKPNYIHIASRLAPSIYFDTYLNTFGCPISLTGPQDDRDAETEFVPNELMLFPNPTDGTLWVDLSAWTDKEESQLWRIFNSQGQLVMTDKTTPGEDLMRIELSHVLKGGLYFFEIQDKNGKKETQRFVLQY